MAKKVWWPSSMADQATLMQNFLTKIPNYGAVLGMTPAQVTSAQELCQAFIGAYNSTEQCRMTMLALTQWRDNIFYGEPSGTNAPQAPAFPVIGATDYLLGVVKQFSLVRDRILAAPGYTTDIGEDLGLYGATIIPPAPETVIPSLKATTTAGYMVNISGSMQGADAMRVEYAPDGGNFAPVAFLTNTPGGFQITPAVPNKPESGQIRAVYIKKNAEYGNYSANYPITVS